MFRLFQLRQLIPALVAFALMAPALAPAQRAIRAEKGRDKYADLPFEFKELLREEDAKRAAQEEGRELRDVVGVPWVNAMGDQLVGVVEEREMTEAQLARRVNLLLQFAPEIADPIKAQDRRILYESRVLSDWKEMAMLAHHAEVRGTMVTDAEVKAAYDQLLVDGGEGAYEASQQAASQANIQIPEVELLREVRDGLIVEKYVRKRLRETVSDNTRRRLYQARPQEFIEPTRVKAWHLFLPTLRYTSDSQRKENAKLMKRWRKKLDKADDEEEYSEVMREIAAEQPLSLTSAKWYQSNEQLEGEMKKALFTTDPDDVSDIVRSNLGWHCVKVIERIDGEMTTFENARDKIDDFLFAMVRDKIYEQIRGHYKVYTDASGLRKWLPVEKPATAAAEKTPKAPTEAEAQLLDIPEISDTGAIPEPKLDALRKKLKPANPAEAGMLAPLPLPSE